MPDLKTEIEEIIIEELKCPEADYTENGKVCRKTNESCGIVCDTYREHLREYFGNA